MKTTKIGIQLIKKINSQYEQRMYNTWLGLDSANQTNKQTGQYIYTLCKKKKKKKRNA